MKNLFIIILTFVLSLDLSAQTSAYTPFHLSREMEEVFKYKDSTFEIHEIYFIDTVTKDILFDNTGFTAFAKRTDNCIKFERYVTVGDTSRVKFATAYLMLFDSCYEFIQVYDGSTVKVKTIEQIRKLKPNEQNGELILGMLFKDHTSYLNEFIALGTKNLKNFSFPVYAGQRQSFFLQGLLGRKDNGYFTTGKKLTSRAFTNCN